MLRAAGLLWAVAATASQYQGGEEAMSLLQLQAERIPHEAQGPRRRQELRHEPSALLQSHSARSGCAEEDDNCMSMCRWLKLSTKETEGLFKNTLDNEKFPENSKCPLLEMQLRSGGWEVPEHRQAEKKEDPIDCAVNIVRANVFANEVPAYIEQLTTCIHELPMETHENYKVAVTLLASEIDDWKREQEVLTNATRLRADLWKVSNASELALKNHEHEDEVVADLERTLREAVALPGHFLVHEVKIARSFLEQLSPIPPVKKELKKAIKEASEATMPHRIETEPARELGDLLGIIVQLNVSIHDAEELGITESMPEARQALSDLTEFRNHLKHFRDSMQQANISLGTKQNMLEARMELRKAIPWAEHAGLERGLPRANFLVEKLGDAIEVLKGLKESSHEAKQTLLTRKQHEEEVRAAIEGLNQSLAAATRLDIGGHQALDQAMEMLDHLEYLEAAYRALATSGDEGARALRANLSSLDDAAQQASIQRIEPALEWAHQLGINKGVEAVATVLKGLHQVSNAKGNMTEALALGNSSYNAQYGEENAVEELEGALHQEKEVHVTAGAHDAQELLEKLRSRLLAKERFNQIMDQSRSAITTGIGLEAAITALKHLSIDLHKAGLSEQASIAESMARTLEVTLRSQQAEHNRTLQHSNDTYSISRDSAGSRANDMKAMLGFERTGYKPVHLKAVNGTEDDGDSDFDEHIDAVRKAIEDEHAQGVVDPDHEVLLETLQRKQTTYGAVQQALREGQDAFAHKQNVEEAIEHLIESLDEAERYEVSIGMKEAKEQLHLLQRIQPAIDEFESARLQAHMSLHSENHMGESLATLRAAMDLCKELDIHAGMKEAETLYQQLTKLKEVHVNLKAAIMQGEYALDAEQGEERAADHLKLAIVDAQEVNLSRDVALANDLLRELQLMNEEQNDLAKAVNPLSRKTDNLA